jgi:hypothetical protein
MVPVLYCTVGGMLTVASAVPVTLDFDQAPAGIPATPYHEEGYTLINLQGSPADGIFAPSSGLNTNGTNVFNWCAGCVPGGAVIQLTAHLGTPFAFLQLEAANLEAFDTTNQSISVTGYRGPTPVATQTLQLSDTWTLYHLSGFTDVDRVVFSVGDAFPDPAVDNLRVAAVPEPATVLLLTTGLVGLLAYGRRRARQASWDSGVKEHNTSRLGT